MEAIRKAVEWMATAQVPEDAMIRHLGMKHESGVRFMPVSEASRYKLPVFMFSKDWGFFSAAEISALRSNFDGLDIVSELVGKTFYTVTINVVPNPTVRSAYERYMQAVEGIGLDAPQLNEPLSKTPLPEGWTW